MKVLRSIPFFFAMVLAIAVYAQDDATAPLQPQNPMGGPGSGQGPGGGSGGGPGQGGMGMGAGRGTTGTVTAVSADSYSIKTDSGEIYSVRIGSNTRIMKQAARRNDREQGAGQRGGQGQPTAQQTLKVSDVKVGDTVTAMGEVDANTKSVTATMVMLLDAERVKQMREMQANYGKTWLAGKVTAIEDVKVTIQGTTDNAAHAFVADENTTFRKNREPITLADIQAGDTVRVEGSIKDGNFLATSVMVMSMPAAGASGAPSGGQPNMPGANQPNAQPAP
jgi:hypothetical protein